MIDIADALEGVCIKCLEEDDWQDLDDEFDASEFQNVKDSDTEILIANFDMVKMITKANHQIGDDVKSMFSQETIAEKSTLTPSLEKLEKMDIQAIMQNPELLAKEKVKRTNKLLFKTT